jgi:hypothetical protein
MTATPKGSTSSKLVHNPQSPYSQKKKDQKENQEPSPVMDKPALEDQALKGFYNPTGLPTTGCYSLYKLAITNTCGFVTCARNLA